MTVKHIVMKLYEDNNDDSSEFMHVCIIIIFLLIRLLYSLIHSLNHLLQFIQFNSMFINLINFIAVSSLITCCM